MNTRSYLTQHSSRYKQGLSYPQLSSEIGKAQLFEQQELNQLLIETLPAALITMDEIGLITSWNKGAEELFAYTSEEMIGKSFVKTVLSPSYCGAYQEELTALMNNKQKNSTRHYNMSAQKRNGDSFPIELTLNALSLNSSYVLSAFIQDVSRHQLTQEALKRDKEAAEATARAKSQFLANMSHEIRTPLNAIIGMSELLSVMPVNPEQKEMVDIIHNSGETLLSLINDILDYSKIEAEKLELETEPFNLRQCIEEALDLVAVKATEKGLELAYLIDSNLPLQIVGDMTRLHQILVNLLSNAVKFTTEGEVVVEVQGELIGEQIYKINFAIKDTGIGIPQERISCLFDSFSQVDSSTTRIYGGSGLGLAISKRLVEMMGGTIGVQSRLGEGSTFFFSLVVEATSEQKEHDIEASLASLAILSGKRVLIVDDNQTNRRILTSQTKSWGMTPIAVASGIQALNLMRREPFDIAILDMQMPLMDGLTLAKRIRHLNQESPESWEGRNGSQNLSNADLPLIILTSLVIGKPLDNELTNVTYLTKPTKSTQLCEILMRLLAEPSHLNKVVGQTTTTANPFDEGMATRHPLRILLAEDNIVNQKVALHLLKRLGYEAEVVNNGYQVLQTLQKKTIDVILMDVEMPEMDGIEATKQIHAQTTLNKRPHIIAMTAHALAGDRARLIAAGMDDYIRKPIEVKHLVSALQRVPSSFTATDTTERKSIKGTLLNTVRQAVKEMIGQDDPQVLKDLIELFLGDARQQVSLLQQRLNNHQELKQISHTLKGSSASLGLISLSTLCNKLEQIITEGRSKASLISQKVAEIEVEYKRIEKTLILA